MTNGCLNYRVIIVVTLYVLAKKDSNQRASQTMMSALTASPCRIGPYSLNCPTILTRTSSMSISPATIVESNPFGEYVSNVSLVMTSTSAKVHQKRHRLLRQKSAPRNKLPSSHSRVHLPRSACFRQWVSHPWEQVLFLLSKPYYWYLFHLFDL